MEKNRKLSQKFLSRTVFCLFIVFFAALIFTIIILSTPHYSKIEKNLEAESREYHILVVGNYENEVITNQIYKGAANLAETYNAVVELYIPNFQTSNNNIQSLWDYAGFLNADGIITYIDSSTENLNPPLNAAGQKIPLVTAGFFNPDLPQVSFIGNSYWEIGKKISDEVINLLHGEGSACIVNNYSPSNPNQSTLINSLQSSFQTAKNITYRVVPKISLSESSDLYVCLSEEDTIQTVQFFQEFYPTRKFKVIGFGSNSTCELYLDKGLITELVTINPEKIGEEAISALFAFISKGYSNNYITAEVKIRKAKNEDS